MRHPPDECTSKEDDSSDSDVNNDDIHINTNVQSETIGKDGVSWSTQRTTTPGCLHTTNIMKKKPGSVTRLQTIIEAFKLFITKEILDKVVLQTNKYASRYFDRQNQKQLNAGTNPTKSNKWKQLGGIELEAFIGLLIS